MLKIGIIGGGNMGTAIISRTFKDYDLCVCEKDPSRAALLKKKFRAAAVDLPELVASSDVIILAIKPQDMENVLKELKNFLTPQKLVISIAAGLTTRFFEKQLGSKNRLIRAMPNMPAQIGLGVTALSAGRRATAKDLAVAVKIFEKIGQTFIVDERLMDSVTAVSGSGPAYVFFFVECFQKAAEKVGIDPDMARKLVGMTLFGSMSLYLQSQESPGDLRAKVTSKGGTTQAAMDIFLSHHFEQMFIDAVAAAKTRAKELAK